MILQVHPEEPDVREQPGEKKEPEAEEASDADMKEEPAVREDTKDGDADLWVHSLGSRVSGLDPVLVFGFLLTPSYAMYGC